MYSILIQVSQVQGTADIFRGFMVSLYVKGKENGHVQAYAPTGAMGLKRWGGLTSKLDGHPIASDPHLWWQACPWRKSLSRKIALTRIKFYGRKLSTHSSTLMILPTDTLLCGNCRIVGWLPPHSWMATATLLCGYRHTLWLTCRTV